MSRPGEFELIDRYFKPLALTAGAFGLGDDAAVLTVGAGKTVVVTTDAVAAGVHFFTDDPPEAIAAKALRVNLSDLAAKGAEPLGYLLVLALAAGWSEDWVQVFARGLAADQTRYGITLLGGDTLRAAGGTTIAITAFGTIEGSMVQRRGARAGDALFVSGTIGDAALGLWLRDRAHTALSADPRYRRLLQRYLYPEPRLALAAVLRAYASAAMDISDGLMGDLGRLCVASGVTATVNVEGVPLSPAAADLIGGRRDLMTRVLAGGDDYEILATVAPANVSKFIAGAKQAGVPVAEIGRIVAGEGPPKAMLGGGEELPLERLSYDHFAGSDGASVT
ncbi:MAG: thiamine-phosphate kinase [Bauldia sp.]